MKAEVPNRLKTISKEKEKKTRTDLKNQREKEAECFLSSSH